MMTQKIQSRVAQTERGRSQQTCHCQIISRVRQGMQDVQDIADLGTLIKSPSRDRHKGNTGFFEGIFIPRVSGRGAKEQGNIIPTLDLALFTKLEQALSKGARRCGSGIFGILPGAQDKFDMRIGDMIGFFLAIGVQRTEWNIKGLPWTIFHSHHTCE